LRESLFLLSCGHEENHISQAKNPPLSLLHSQSRRHSFRARGKTCLFFLRVEKGLTSPLSRLSLTRNQNNTMKDLITKENLVALLRSKKEAVIEALNGKNVVYLNEGESKVKPNGVRNFKILDIEHVGTGKTGRTFITAKVEDLNDNSEIKYRNLHVAGLELAWE
jgi:hypothetical protein